MIPIYRAKKIDSNEYVEGYYTKSKGGIVHEIEEHLILPFLDLKGFAVVDTDYERIDLLTLAIHFPDMIDSEGTKIFASLSKDGKGGDMAINLSVFEMIKDVEKSSYPLLYSHGVFASSIFIANRIGTKGMKKMKVVGIQQ